MLVEELVSFHDQHKLQLNMLVEEVKSFAFYSKLTYFKPETYWPGLTGEVKLEILQDTLPPPGSYFKPKFFLQFDF